MTDEQINALEVAANKMLTTGGGQFTSFYNEDFSKVILELIAELRQLREELRQVRTERYWLARDIAHSARKNWWDERTWTIEYWLARAAKEATCPKN